MSNRFLIAGTVALALLIGAWPFTAAADEAWVVRGRVDASECRPPELLFVWLAETVLYNAGSSDAHIRYRVVTPGGPSGERELVVAPGHSRGLFTQSLGIGVTKIEMPPDVVIDSRLEYHRSGCGSRPEAEIAQGRLAMPFFRSLTPPGQRLVHPGVDLGNQDVRTNVGIFNAGETTATAVIELHYADCPNATPATEIVAVAPKELRQITLRSVPPVGCEADLGVKGWVRYITTTVDQPSLSYAVSLSNVAAPGVTVGFSGPAQ